MLNAPKCARCGQSLTPDAPKGLCPRCLMALNLATQTEVSGDDVGPAGTHLIKPLPAPAPSAEEIARLFPQFEIIECLGRGGMGAVYKARQPKLDRFVALKILLPERQGGGQFAERFAREARALARLNHPDIVAVYDFGEVGGYPYLVMEYVDGLSLRQLLQRGRLAPEEALVIVPKICAALHFAHHLGIVHRDIKPENILLDKSGQVKIADFGIAKILVPGAQDLSLTGGKDVVGTPHYMAPEQIEQPTKVDHRADIFSLGVVFYEMLTGELPLGKFQPPSQKVQMDVRLDEVVLHALEKEPERRYQHASDVKCDIETIVAAPTSAQTTHRPERPDPVPASQRWQEGWRSRVAVVIVREGKRVVHWPGVAMSSALMAGVVLVGAYLRHIGSNQPFWSHGMFLVMVALVFGTISLAIYLGLRRQPIERLVSLDDHTGANVPLKPGNEPVVAPLAVQIARWTARILGSLWALILLAFLLGEGSPAMGQQPASVQFAFAAVGLMLAGVAAGWWRDGLAVLLLLGGWAFFHVV